MVISHKYKFIFVKTLKTAGTSIEVYLSRVCGEQDIVTPVFPQVDGHRPRHFRGLWNPLPEWRSGSSRGRRRDLRDLRRLHKFYNHIPARSIRFRVAENVWNSYYKFCVERNPWDKTLSDYFMMKDRRGGSLTLDEYLDEGRFSLNYPLYTNREGELMVDRVIRYEKLMPELGEVFNRLGVPFDGDLGSRAKSEHRKERRHYRDVLTPSQRDRISEAFATEIAMHHYDYQAD